MFKYSLIRLFYLFFFVFFSTAISANVIINNAMVGNSLHDFATSTTGSYSGLLTLNGASYGEHFTGQTVTVVNDLDVITGIPDTQLNLVANLNAADNIGLVSYQGNNAIFGDVAGMVGEGALSVLFDIETDVLGFDIVGSNNGDFTVDFFANDGSLLNSITQSVTNSFFGFSVQTGALISGISITNIDIGGIGFNNFTFNGNGNGNTTLVPEPLHIVWLAFGLLTLVSLGKKKSG